MAPKTGNRNAMTSGVYSFLATGRAPKGTGYVYRQLGQFKAKLTRDVEVIHGQCSLLQASQIQSVIRHEARAALLTRWLRTEESLSFADRLNVLKEIGAATDTRDKLVARLLGEPGSKGPTAAAMLYGDEPETGGIDG